MTTAEKIAKWESLWATYMAKLARLDELRAMGRYGYQLKMPRFAVRKASQAIRDFDAATGERPLMNRRNGDALASETW